MDTNSSEIRAVGIPSINLGQVNYLLYGDMGMIVPSLDSWENEGEHPL